MAAIYALGTAGVGRRGGHLRIASVDIAFGQDTALSAASAATLAPSGRIAAPEPWRAAAHLLREVESEHDGEE
jgi:hypothetical protein